MKNLPACLLGLALLRLGLAAQGQTTPAAQPKNPPAKSTPRPTGPAPKPRATFSTPLIKDTAAFGQKFRRYSRPADAVPNRLQPIK